MWGQCQVNRPRAHSNNTDTVPTLPPTQPSGVGELFQPLIVLDLICAVDLFLGQITFHFCSSSVHLFRSAAVSLRPSPTSSLTILSNSDQPPAHHHTIHSSLTLQPSFTTQPPLSLAISLSRAIVFHGQVRSQNWGSLSRSHHHTESESHSHPKLGN
ncbi:hypothetical protein DVH24_020917 [Malus domestica]|uniref:Uncharacterized protein n=1 Tax=Malus domestica TaxID=3750 RepID=A0A498JCP3_MALDO|nr:hypothetical protein DVH24_020917 [Malus domestica]